MHRSLDPPRRRDEAHSSSHDKDGACRECGETYNAPLLATLTSEGSSRQYYACPRCLTKVGEVKTQRKEETKEIPKPEFKEAITKPEIDGNCQHFLGFLKKRSKDEAIPDECLTCSKMVECLY